MSILSVLHMTMRTLHGEDVVEVMLAVSRDMPSSVAQFPLVYHFALSCLVRKSGIDSVSMRGHVTREVLKNEIPGGKKETHWVSSHFNHSS